VGVAAGYGSGIQERPLEERGSLLRERLWVALVLGGAAFLSLYRLGAGSLWDQDETKYAQVAVELLQTGDAITLHVNGLPWYVHPPFYMWLVAATGHFAGFTEFTVRVWSALFSVLTVYATILVGRALFGHRTGLLAGAILAVTLQPMAQSRLAVFDTVLLAWMLLGVYFFLRGYKEGRRADYLWFFLFAGLATLTKGPIGLLLPALVIVPFVALRRTWDRLRDVPWAAGIGIYAVVGLSWYALETWLHGRQFVSTVLGYYMFSRFFGVVENQAGPWSYYVPVVLLGAFPWTAFWPAAAAFHGRRWQEDDGSLFCLLWVGIAFLFYSVAGTKLPNYVLPIYPLAAVAVAAVWDAALRGQERGRGIDLSFGLLLVLIAALFAGIAGYLRGTFPDPYRAVGHLLVPPAGALLLGAFLALLLAWKRRTLPAFVTVCVTMAVAWTAVLTWVMPVVEVYKPMKPLALAIKRDLRPDDRIVGYRMSILSSLIFYTDHHVDWVEHPDELHKALCAPGRVFLVIRRGDLEPLQGQLPKGLRSFAERLGTAVLVKPAHAVCNGAAENSPRYGPVVYYIPLSTREHPFPILKELTIS
jgi:4-amino-4-deoxy-L-arabinose transferase-like glycosyltransferase